MRVDVVQLLSRDARFIEGDSQEVLQGSAIAWERGHMVGVHIRGEGDNFRVDVSMTRQRQLAFFEQQDTGSLSHDESVSVSIVWARSLFWLIIAGTHGAQDAENVESSEGDGRVGSTCEHPVDAAFLNSPVRLSDGVCASRAASG